MRRLFAIAASAALLLASWSGTALANHKNQGKGPHHVNECTVETNDPLPDFCLNL